MVVQRPKYATCARSARGGSPPAENIHTYMKRPKEHDDVIVTIQRSGYFVLVQDEAIRRSETGDQREQLKSKVNLVSVLFGRSKTEELRRHPGSEKFMQA